MYAGCTCLSPHDGQGIIDTADMDVDLWLPKELKTHVKHYVCMKAASLSDTKKNL